MMDERINKVAASANEAIYDSEATRQYIDGAPHIKHALLRALYGRLVVSVFDFAAKYSSVAPEVLDIGAGEGAVTLPFLMLGAKVTAVDTSQSQLKQLRKKCANYDEKLIIRCQDVFDVIRSAQADGKRYDVIVANSFLHHIPDYLGMLKELAMILPAHGQFFSFQDPLRYDSVSIATKMFSKTAYFSWRIFKGDLFNGIKRYIRRSRGIYIEDSIHDNAEYHVTRGGVDQRAICGLFRSLGFDCKIIEYFSTQSRIWQFIGVIFGVKNTFAIIAKK